MADVDDTGHLFPVEPAKRKRRKKQPTGIKVPRLPGETKQDHLRRYAREVYRHKKATDPDFLADRAAKTTAYNKRHPEIVRQRKLDYAATHREQERLRAAKWYKEHPKQATASRRAWRELNRDKVNEFSRSVRHARRAKIKAGGKHTVDDIRDIRRLQKNRCALCGAGLKKKGVIDHIMPIKLGGSNDRKNIQLLCSNCNHRKNAKHPLVYSRLIGLLL